jgi:hypothetical protein
VIFYAAAPPKGLTKPLHAVPALSDDETGDVITLDESFCKRFRLDELDLGGPPYVDWPDTDANIRCAVCDNYWRAGAAIPIPRFDAPGSNRL